jgi:membrane associated rhomboid family serine protease
MVRMLTCLQLVSTAAAAAAQVEPYFCYLVMATQLAVYGAGTWLAVAQGPEAAEAWALALALQPSEVLGHGESWRLLTSLLLHGGLTHLALDTFFLGWMGPGGTQRRTGAAVGQQTAMLAAAAAAAVQG